MESNHLCMTCLRHSFSGFDGPALTKGLTRLGSLKWIRTTVTLRKGGLYPLSLSMKWCIRRDSNSQAIKRKILSLLCISISTTYASMKEILTETSSKVNTSFNIFLQEVFKLSLFTQFQQIINNFTNRFYGCWLTTLLHYEFKI